MYHLLIVCTGNICRSPMAEGLAHHFLPGKIQGKVSITSAGVGALHGNPAQAHAVSVMAGMGIDISGHRARQITAQAAAQADVILTMEAVQRDMVRRMLLWKKSKVRLLTEFNPQSLEPEIKDPYGGPLQAYQICLDTLLPCVEVLMAWVSTQVGDSHGS